MLAAGLCGAELLAAEPSTEAGAAPAYVARREEPAPRRDVAGRIHYIVDLHDAATRGLPDTAAPADGFASHHDIKTRHLVDGMKSEYGFTPTTLTSHVGKSFSAFLTGPQVERLRKDARVKRVTEDGPVELSAVWTDRDGWEVIPWGVRAIGGPRDSMGTRRVYVLDSGVDTHGDLNVVERLSAIAGASAIGCYPHSTHVAGIIGARQYNGGLVGINAGAPIVSVAIGHQNQPSGCSEGRELSSVSAGLDVIRERIRQSGVVGIVNLSVNSVEFNVGRTLGDKLRALATPAPGYPGAFIVESAGNGFVDACGVSYNDPAVNDGIMVAGAIDDNGQPVRPLNGLARFRNAPLAGNERGSNFGACVQLWAPGNGIRSTWSGGGYATLSGTSMAAPHVAGVAAHLAERENLTTPAEIEHAVRAHTLSLYGSPAIIPTLSGQPVYAIPTVEFAEEQQVVGSFDQFNNDPVHLRYDSVGASSCNLRVLRNGALWYQSNNLGPSGVVASGTLPQGQYQWTLDCVNGNGSVSGTVATANIRRAVTRVAWYIATTSTGYAWTEFTGNADPRTDRFTWSAGAPLYQRYESVGADACEVRTHGIFNFGWSETLLWNSGQFPTSHLFDTFYLPNPRTAAPPLGPYERYSWSVRCWNSEGSSMMATVTGTQSP